VSPKSSARSISALRSGGTSGGSGCSSSRKRAIRRLVWTRVPSTLIAGTVRPGKPRALMVIVCTPGGISRTFQGMPLCSSISIAERQAWDPGIVYSSTPLAMVQP
jgi:hypothetical protein